MALPPLYDEHIRRTAGGATRSGETSNQVSLVGQLEASALRDLIQGVEAMGGDVSISNGVVVIRTSPDIVPNGSGGGGGAQVLADVTLNSPGASFSTPTIDLSSWFLVRVIAQLQAGAAGEGAGNWVRAAMRFNGDNGANYIWGTQKEDGTFINQGTAGYVNGIQGLWGSGTNFSTSFFGDTGFDLVSPGASGQFKAVSYQGGAPAPTTQQIIGFGSGYWKNTAPITQISMVSNDGTNFAVGSRIVVLGLAQA